MEQCGSVLPGGAQDLLESLGFTLSYCEFQIKNPPLQLDGAAADIVSSSCTVAPGDQSWMDKVYMCNRS